MTKEHAIEEAQAIANKERMTMAVANDPIANAEEEGGPWGYCPNCARHTEGLMKGNLILYPWADETILIHPE
jgi:hypothetical protein